MKKKLLLKLINLTIKKKELDLLLKDLGFQLRQAKGSHEVWKKDSIKLTIATHNKDVKRYILRQIIKLLKINKII